jgi:hypothetical protein
MVPAMPDLARPTESIVMKSHPLRETLILARQEQVNRRKDVAPPAVEAEGMGQWGGVN